MNNNMLGLCFLLHVLALASASNTGSHSLCSVATFIAGETPFPEFTVLMMLDDIVLTNYNSDETRTVPRIEKDNFTIEEQDFADLIFSELHKDMRSRTNHLKKHLNDTNAIHVEQRLECCELLSNDEAGQMKMIDAFDGLSGLEMDYNMHQQTLHTENQWRLDFDALQLEYNRQLYAYFLHPTCISALRRGLKEFKNLVLRKEKPRVRLLTMLNTRSGGARVTCLATGFYPRHLNLTLLKDGQPISENLVTGGELLPNGDRTYQMRKSMEVSSEDLKRKHNYTCTATHLSLDNKLDIHMDYDPGSPLVFILFAVLLVCVMPPTVAFLIWKKRHVVSRTSSQSDYTVSSTTEEKQTERMLDCNDQDAVVEQND